MSATEVLTAVLVIVTGYYAWQNRRMVREMAATREITVLPSLALEWTMLGPTLGVVTLRNVGPGPALDVNVSIRFEPLPESSDPPDVRPWTASLIAPGRAREFLPMRPGDGGVLHTEQLAETYAEVRLTGTYRDVLGKVYEAEDVLPDIREWRRITGESKARWQYPEPEKRLAEALAERFHKKFDRPLRDLTGEVAQIRRTLEGPPDED
jgi:hypothetical protein